MLKISEFSKLSRISMRMLRYYDENDLLKPKIVKENGYRYYDHEQLLTAAQIKHLRDIGFSIYHIKQILTVCQNKDEIKHYLTLHLYSLYDEEKQIQQQIKTLTRTIQYYQQEEEIMCYQVEVKTIPTMYMVCKKGTIPTYEKEGLLWQGMMNEIKETNMNIKFKTNGINMAVFYNQGYQEHDPVVEIRSEVEGQYIDSENIQFKNIPAQKVASVTFKGSYHQCIEVSYYIIKWIKEHDYQICGANFAIYHTGYFQTNNEVDFITEICFPIQ